MSDTNGITEVEATPAKAPKASKKPTTKKPMTLKAAVEKKVGKKPVKPKTVANDGSLRGMEKPKGWKPEKQLMVAYLAEPCPENMNKCQMRVLQLLAKPGVKGPVTRNVFTEPNKMFDDTAAISSDSYVGVWVGRSDPNKRAESEKKWGYVSLITMGYVKIEKTDDNDKKDWVYSITAKGKAALEKKLKHDAAKASTKE